MTTEGFWKAGRFPGSVIALLLLENSTSTVIQSLHRGAYEIGLRFRKCLVTTCAGAVRYANQRVAAIVYWTGVKLRQENPIRPPVRCSADAPDKFAGYVGLQYHLRDAGQRDLPGGDCQGSAARTRCNRISFDTANVEHGGRDTVGRCT